MSRQKKPLNILALEPYYDRSRKAFLDEWIKRSVHHWTLMTLPGYTPSIESLLQAYQWETSASTMDQAATHWPSI